MFIPPHCGGECLILGGNSPQYENAWGGVLHPKIPPRCGGEFFIIWGGVGGSALFSKIWSLPPRVGGSFGILGVEGGIAKNVNHGIWSWDLPPLWLKIQTTGVGGSGSRAGQLKIGPVWRKNYNFCGGYARRRQIFLTF